MYKVIKIVHVSLCVCVLSSSDERNCKEMIFWSNFCLTKYQNGIYIINEEIFNINWKKLSSILNHFISTEYNSCLNSDSLLPVPTLTGCGDLNEIDKQATQNKY